MNRKLFSPGFLILVGLNVKKTLLCKCINSLKQKAIEGKVKTAYDVLHSSSIEYLDRFLLGAFSTRILMHLEIIWHGIFFLYFPLKWYHDVFCFVR